MNFKLRVGLFIMLLSLSACGSDKADPVNRHDKTPATESSKEDTKKTEPAKTTEGVKWEQRFTKSQNKGQDLKTLAEKILNPDWIRDASKRTDREARELLVVLNRELLGQMKSTTPAIELTGILQRYMAMLELDCEKSVASCPGLHIFKRVETSAEVIRLLARRHQAETLRFYRLLGFAFEIKNQILDVDLLRHFVSNVSIYLSKVKGLANGGQQELARFRPVFETVLGQLRNQNDWTWSKGLPLWDLLMDQDLNLNLSSKIIIGEAIGRFALKDPRGGMHSQFLKVWTDASASPRSYASVLKKLKDSKVIKLQNVGLQEITNPSLVFRLADLVFIGKLQSEVAFSMLSQDKFTLASLRSDMLALIRTHFFMGVLESTQLFRSRVLDSEVVSDALLSKAFVESQAIQSVWALLSESMGTVQTFAVNLARQSGFSEEDVVQTRQLFDGLDKSIKMTVLYPHLMALFHIASKKQFERDTPYGAIKSSDFMVRLYNGEYPVVLPYTKDIAPLNAVEMYYAFDFAIRTGLFQVAGIDLDDFIATTIMRFGEASKGRVRKHLNLVNQRMGGTKEFQDMLKRCDEFTTGRREATTLAWEELRFSPYYGELKGSIMRHLSSENSTVPGGTGTVRVYAQQLNIYDQELAEDVERIRIDFASVVRLGEAMRRSVLLAYPENKTAQTDKAILELLTLKNDYLSTVQNRTKLVGDCAFKIAWRDVEVQKALLNAEAAYLRQVRRDMLKLGQNIPFQIRSSIMDRYKLKGMPGGFPGYDRISAGAYSFSRVDVLARFARYLREGLRTETETIPPIAPHIKVDFGTMDEENVYMGKAQIVDLPLADEETFVNSGMRILLSDKSDDPLHWQLFDLSLMGSWKYHAMALTSIFRMNPTDTNAMVQAADLVDLQVKYLDYIRLTPDELKNYDLVGRISKFGVDYLDTTALIYSQHRQNVSTLKGVFDFNVELFLQPLLGSTYTLKLISENPELADPWLNSVIKMVMPHRFGNFEWNEMYYVARSKAQRAGYWMDFNKDLDTFLDDKMLGLYEVEVQAFNKFEAALKSRLAEFEKMPAEQRPRIDVTVTESVTEPLVTGKLVSDFHTHLDQFNEKSAQCFRNKMKCAAFTPANP